MNLLQVLIGLIVDGLFTHVAAKYFIEMSLQGPGGRHKIHLYECNNDAVQSGTVQCKNVHWWAKKKWIYYHANFYISYGALQQLQQQKKIHLSDMDSHVQFPQVAYIGFRPEAIDGPGVDGEPPGAYNFFWEQVEHWGALVDYTRRVGLTRFLATPDMSQLLPRPELMLTYFGAYLQTLEKITKNYGEKILKSDSFNSFQQTNRASSVTDFARKDFEKELKRVIPLMMKKMLDPCLLYGPSTTPAEGNSVDIEALCKTYCTFLRVTTKLYKKSSSRLCKNLGEGGVCDGKVCKCNQYFVIKIPLMKQKKIHHRVPMVYCNNVFRLRNEEPALKPVR